MWNKMSAYPGGKRLFSLAVARKAPYFSTISPTVEEMRPNYARVSFKKRRRVENHIRTVHVIAICNLLEMAMGVCAEASVPSHLRWIPKGMNLDYTAKAETDIHATAEIDPAAWKPGDLDVKVTAFDTHNTVVVRGVIRLWVSEKKK
jgi:acyl-coenzyme A thioesterase PaaI-like protein